MAVPGSGLGGQVMFAEESTWGTQATVTRALRIDSESLKFTKKTVQGQGITAGNYLEDGSLRADVASWVAGDLDFDMTTKNMGLFWKHALGHVVSAQQGGTAAWKHTFTLGSDINGLGLTVQAGRPQTDSTVKARTYSGLKVDKWQLTAPATDIVKAKFSFIGKARDTVAALGTPSYPTGNNTFRFNQGAVTVAGSPYIAIRDFTVNGDNVLAPDRFYFGNAGQIAEPIRKGFVKIGGQFTADYINTTMGDAFVQDNELAIVLTFVGAQIATTFFETLTLTFNGVRLNGDEEVITGPDILNNPVTFDNLLPKAGGTSVQVDYTTLDTTP